jgi:hypothetical protein
MLFDDHDRATAAARRVSPVAKATVSKAAYRKASTQRTNGGDGEVQPVHSFRTLLDDLATLTRNAVCFGGQKMLTVQTTPTPVQRRAFRLLGSNWQRRRQRAIWVQSRINGLPRKGRKVRARGVEHKIGLGRARHPPANDAPREGVDDQGDVDKPLPGRDVRAHLQPLAEPDVNLSAYPAPIIHPTAETPATNERTHPVGRSPAA